MARMIPPRVAHGTTGSERRVFDLLRLAPGSDDWTVLHSLGLSSRGAGKPFGEIDFVVLVPGRGIACLEVKGGRVRCENGVWSTHDGSGGGYTFARSPFLQAREGMFALRKAVQREFGPGAESAVLFTAGVVFPDVGGPPITPEFERWEYLDLYDLRQPISAGVEHMLDREAARIGKGDLHATHGTLKEIRNYLRPDFDAGIARATTIRRAEERLIRLTDEQYDALDILEANRQTLVTGAAGTGKTMLALEHARRRALAGDRVLLLCFNRLLGDWLASAVSGTAGIRAGSALRYLRNAITSSSFADEFSAEEAKARRENRETYLFNEIYPLYAQLALGELGESHDLLIIDEGQDLVGTATLQALDASLAGGLAGGRWVVFGDFVRQAIYGGDGGGASASLGQLELSSPHFSRAPLRRNCRNTRTIGEETALLSGFEALPYRLDDGDCLPVDYRYWSSQEDAAEVLGQALHQLLDDGVRPSDIVLLSPRRFERSAASTLAEVDGIPIRQIKGLAASDDQSVLGFSTVHAFKGLESPVVVLCDLDGTRPEMQRSLLYTGMSRARSHLILHLGAGMKDFVNSAIRRRLDPDWKG